MKRYNTPELIEEIVVVEDVIASSNPLDVLFTPGSNDTEGGYGAY